MSARLAARARWDNLTAMFDRTRRDRVDARVDDRGALLPELMAVFDELPPALRAAINYAPEPLDPKDLATLCRRHGAANVLAMIELKLRRRGTAPPTPAGKSP
jgi:hypothetical protein